MEWQLLGVSVSVLRAGAVNTGMLPASTKALSRFTEKTALYSLNARRFARVVDSVEARHVSPEKLAKRLLKILKKRRVKFAYAINRNPLLLLLEALPSSLRFFIIRRILQ
jgi:short-subunit dehydrogenase